VANNKLPNSVSSPDRLSPTLAQGESEIKPNLVCAVDLGGTNLRAAIIDCGGEIHDRLKFRTPQTENPNEIVAAINSAVEQCSSHVAQRKESIHAVSVVVPGSLNAATGLVVNAPNVPAIVNFDLTSALARELERPILIENDANAAAVGELWKGAARGHSTIVCFTLGTGVGSGVILNGELWHGIDGTGGEIGHTSVEPFGGIQCNCGNFGCLEVYASATALVRMTRERLKQHCGSPLNAIAHDNLTAKIIFEAAVAGDELARSVFETMGTYLGVAIANVVNTFNPEMIVIGGGVSAAFDWFAPRAREEMMRRAFPVPAARCEIVKAECGDDAGLLGAAKLAFQKRLR
jgi:glucokinase